jgi:hypothetical protein
MPILANVKIIDEMQKGQNPYGYCPSAQFIFI